MKVTAVTANCRSRLTPRWPARAARMARMIGRIEDVQFIGEQECYAAFRPILDREYRKRSPHLRVAGTNRGKVLRYRSDQYKLVTGSVRRYSLGNGKHAVAALFESRAMPGFLIAVGVGHLLNGKRNGAKRRAQARRFVNGMSADYSKLTQHVLMLADWNDTDLEDVLHATSLRMRDAKRDTRRRRNAEFDTYHGYKSRPPRRGKHIDRTFRSHTLRCTFWSVLVGSPPYPSDHFPVLTRFSTTSRLP